MSVEEREIHGFKIEYKKKAEVDMPTEAN
jgi:hypothetical protein